MPDANTPTTDLYLFGYGRRYTRGRARPLPAWPARRPLLPRFALGNWWSRYHRYTETEYRQLVERFEERRHPVHHGRHRYGLAPG